MEFELMANRSLILHVITRLEAGGAPRSVLLLLEGLANEGLPVELATGLTPPPAEDYLPQAQAIGIPVHIIPSLKRDPHPWQDLKALVSLWFLMIKRRPLLVHAHTSKAGFLGRLAALLAGIRVCVYSPRGTILEGYFSERKRRLFIRLERIAAKWTTKIIGLTYEESESYLTMKIGHPEQHVQIPIGINPLLYAPSNVDLRLRNRRKNNVSDDEILIVTSGRIVPVKDHVTLVRALSLLDDKTSSWKCWILGSGSEDEKIDNLIHELNLQDRIRMWGHVDNIADLLGLADIFTLTSLNEGFGRVLLEAMSAKLAIVATTVGGIPSVLDQGRAGILVPPKDPNALAEALGQLVLSASARESYAEAGFMRVKVTYSLDNSVQQHINLYESILKLQF